METNLLTQKIGRIVADDFRTASVFSNFGIDFCCKGGITLEEACKNHDVIPERLISDLESITKEPHAFGYHDMNLEELVNHVLDIHHVYVKDALPILQTFLEKLCKVHGERHPELFDIREEMMAIKNELEQHMQKEERILFPFLIALHRANSDGFPLSLPHFKHVENPITMMEEEHEMAGDRLRKISTLTNAYTPPAGACQTYRVTFEMLQEFENDLHTHIHLENNMIFPQSIELHNKFFASKLS